MQTLPDQFSAVFEASSRSLDAEGAEMFWGASVVEEWFGYAGNEAHVVVTNGPDWSGDALHQLDWLAAGVDQTWLWKALVCM